jgi:HEPN domain-containing protein
MADNYVSAALRHLEDATSLDAAGRYENAAYLAGYVIECALKEVLLRYGYAARTYGHDLRVLHGRALELASLLSPGMAHYRSDAYWTLPAGAARWTPDFRYARTGDVLAGMAGEILAAARGIYERVLVPMILDGRIRSWR